MSHPKAVILVAKSTSSVGFLSTEAALKEESSLERVCRAISLSL